MSDKEKKYLIRSSGSILGPFDQAEIKDLIERGVISTSDEVTGPCSIWWYLRDHSDFKDIVLAVSSKQKTSNLVTRISQKIAKISSKGKTQTKTQTNTQKTQDKTVTDTGTETQSGLTPVRLNPLEKQSAHEIHVAGPTEFSTKNEKRSKVRLIFLKTWPVFIIGFVAVGWIFFQFLYKKEAIQKEQEQLTALKLFDEGHYQQALPYLEKVLQSGVLDARGRLLLSALWLSKGRVQKAFDLIQELKGHPVLETGEGHLIQGLLAFSNGKITTAKEFFKMADSSPQKDMAWLNLALLNWKTGDYSSSLLYLDRLMKIAYDRDIVFFLKALNLLFQGKIKPLLSYILLDLGLDQKKPLVKEYKQEFYFLLAYAQSQQDQKSLAKISVSKLLNEDPFFYQEYKYSPFVITTIKQTVQTWNVFHPYCLQIFHSDSQQSLMNALLGFCLLKNGDIKQSLNYIERAKNIEVENPLFLALYAHFLIQNGEMPKAEEVLDLIEGRQLQSGQTLAFIIKARMFEQKKDWARAFSAWTLLLEKNPLHLSGLAGATWASFQLKESSRSEFYKKQLLQIYPHHIRNAP